MVATRVGTRIGWQDINNPVRRLHLSSISARFIKISIIREYYICLYSTCLLLESNLLPYSFLWESCPTSGIGPSDSIGIRDHWGWPGSHSRRLPVLALLLKLLMVFLLLVLLLLVLVLLLPLLLHSPLFTERSTKVAIRAARTPITRGAHGVTKTLHSVAGKNPTG
jgi:hypothetical protein